jgi:hypothetical protein
MDSLQLVIVKFFEICNSVKGQILWTLSMSAGGDYYLQEGASQIIVGIWWNFFERTRKHQPKSQKRSKRRRVHRYCRARV